MPNGANGLKTNNLIFLKKYIIIYIENKGGKL